MKRFSKYLLAFFLILIIAIANVLGILPFSISFSGRSVPRALACSQYAPAGGSLPVGAERTVDATNTGSWRGALASDNIYWRTDNIISGGGLDKRINIDGVALNSANKLVITYEGMVSNALLTYLVQIYDNSGGGTWRTLNDFETALANTTDTTYTYEIYNGYWISGGSPVDTPLANFITSDADKRVQLRIYSTANTASAYYHSLDRLQLEAAVDTYLTAGGMTNSFGGTVANNYTYTYRGGTENSRMSVRNNVAGKAMDYYLSFKNVEYYSDANAILVNYEGYSSTAVLTYNVKIYNFNTPGWETLNSTTLANTADTAYQFAKPNITMSRYVQDGEIRVGFESATVNNSLYHYVDQLYVVVGSVNTDTGKSEVSFGSVAGGTDSLNTQSLDTTAASPVTWQQDTALTATAPYASDWAGTYGTNYSAACNLSFPVTVPADAAVTGVRYAARYRSNVTTNAAGLGILDYSGQFTGVTIAGGWTAVGATNALTTYTYTAGIFQTNPEDNVNTETDLMNLRLRTSTSTAVASVTRDWDFAFVSVRWIGSLNPTGSLTLSGQDVTWINVNPDNPPNNTGKGLTCTVSSNGSWSITVTASSGDAQGRLWSAARSLAYNGTFEYTSTGAAGPTYQDSATSFTASGTNIANYTTPVTGWPITVSYTLGTPTWATLSGSYTSTHTYTLLAL